MWQCVQYAALLTIIGSVYGGNTLESSECLSNRDCPSDRLCAEYKCVNPCVLNLCGDNSNCKVSNHIPVCACNETFSGPLHGGSPSKNAKKRFHLHIEKMNWHAASFHCLSQGMRLATIDSADEQERLSSQIKQANAYKDQKPHLRRWWIGGSDLHKTGEYVWSASGKPITYNNFNDNEPSFSIAELGVRDHCMELAEASNYRWNDFPCDFSWYFICEYYE